MLGFFILKKNLNCSDIAVKKEQDAGAREPLARSADRCMGMSHPLSLAFSKSHPGTIVPFIYGSLFFPSDIWTQLTSKKIVSDTPKCLAKWGASYNSKKGLHACETGWDLF